VKSDADSDSSAENLIETNIDTSQESLTLSQEECIDSVSETEQVVDTDQRTVDDDAPRLDSISKNKDLYVSIFLEASKNKPYSGYELLQSILTSGLRYGKQAVFHYFAQQNIKNQVLFSLASAVEPGVFDLPKMGGFSTPALTLYMNAKLVDDPLMVFEKMLSVANELVESLGGRVLTSKQEILTKEHVRELCMMLNSVEREKANLDLFEVMA